MKLHQRIQSQLRTGWERDYGGAIEAALKGQGSRLLDLLRARRPLTDQDFERLTDYVELTTRGRGSLPEEATREATRLARALLELQVDREGQPLMIPVDLKGRPLMDQPLMIQVDAEGRLLTKEGRPLMTKARPPTRDELIEYACAATEKATGTPVSPDKVYDLLGRPLSRSQ